MSTKSALLPPKIKRSYSNTTRAGAGFFLFGALVGFPGSLLVAWRYHIDETPQDIGLHFLGLNIGFAISSLAARSLLRRYSPRVNAAIFAVLALVSLVVLSGVAPPAPLLWRLVGFALAGAAAGGLLASLLYAQEAEFRMNPAGATNRAGVFLVSGSLLATLIVALTYFTPVSVSPALLLAALSLLLLVPVIGKREQSIGLQTEAHDSLRDSVTDLRNIAAVLFTLLLLFQLGGELAISGWLPLFVIHRLGSNPAWAVCALAAYFLALMIGRLIAQKLLPRVNHRRFLLASMITSVIGSILLSVTHTLTGAWMAVVVIGAGFAPIYPLISEKLDDRLAYHPGFYNAGFAIAITGAMCVPWLLGYLAGSFGMEYVMFVPALGSLVVLILALLIMFEAHLMNGGQH